MKDRKSSACSTSASTRDTQRQGPRPVGFSRLGMKLGRENEALESAWAGSCEHPSTFLRGQRHAGSLKLLRSRDSCPSAAPFKRSASPRRSSSVVPVPRTLKGAARQAGPAPWRTADLPCMPIVLTRTSVSNRGTRGRSRCGARWARRNEPRRHVTERYGPALRAAEVTGRDPGAGHWRDGGGRVLGVSRAGTGPGRLRPGRSRRVRRRPAGSRSAGRGARCRAGRRWR